MCFPPSSQHHNATLSPFLHLRTSIIMSALPTNGTTIAPAAPSPAEGRVSSPSSTAPSPAVAQCSKKKSCENEGLECALCGCRKLICSECYYAFLRQAKIDVTTDALPNNKVACTLKCHRKATEAAAADHSKMSWDDDTPDGRYKESSEALLLDWLKVPGNYTHWRGKKEVIQNLPCKDKQTKW